MSGRTYTMRELLTAARERFGAEASRYKTRHELMAALGLDRPPESTTAPATGPIAPNVPLVLKDFFLVPRG